MRVGWRFQQSFSHRFAFEFDAVGGLYEPVEDGVRERGFKGARARQNRRK